VLLSFVGSGPRRVFVLAIPPFCLAFLSMDGAERAVPFISNGVGHMSGEEFRAQRCAFVPLRFAFFSLRVFWLSFESVGGLHAQHFWGNCFPGKPADFADFCGFLLFHFAWMFILFY
jgi:hypothetical protein